MTKTHEKTVSVFVAYYETYEYDNLMAAIWGDSKYITNNLLDRLLLTSCAYYYEKTLGKPAEKNRMYKVEITRSTRLWCLFTNYRYKIHYLAE